MHSINRVKTIIELQLFIKNPDSRQFIKYSHDAGHAYSYVDHPLVNKIDGDDELEDKLNEWQYSNDECPPCEAYVTLDGQVSSGCGCNDNVCPTEIPDLLQSLTRLQEETGNQYLIQMEEA